MRAFVVLGFGLHVSAMYANASHSPLIQDITYGLCNSVGAAVESQAGMVFINSATGINILSGESGSGLKPIRR